MSDSVDITMEAMVEQYRDEVTHLMNDKMLLQAAMKILSDKQGELTAQVHQLSEDLGIALENNARLNEIAESAQKAAGLIEDVEEEPVPVPALSTEHHIQYTHGSNDRDG
jgi:dynactin complex subunit